MPNFFVWDGAEWNSSPALVAPVSAPSYDLITVPTAVAMLAGGGISLNPAQAAVLPTLITAASVEIQKELHRVIPAADYDEILTPTQGRPDRGIPATVNLTRYPINTSDTQRVSSGRTTAMTIANKDMATNQVARVAFTTQGDPELQLITTGLQLTTIASGVTTRAYVPWTTATTLDGLAAAVNALGGGWSAAVTSSQIPAFGPWPTSELVGARESKGAFNAGASLDIFATDLASYSIDRGSGLLLIGYVTGGGSWFGGGFGGYPGSSWGDVDDDAYAFGGGAGAGYDQVRVSYNAGYTTIPMVFQEFTTEVIKIMLERLSTDTLLQAERAADYAWTARQAIHATALATLLTTLQKYRDFSL